MIFYLTTIYIIGFLLAFLSSALYVKKYNVNKKDADAFITLSVLWPPTLIIATTFLLFLIIIYPLRYLWCKITGLPTPGILAK